MEHNTTNSLLEQDISKLQKKVVKIETIVTKLSSENSSLKVKLNNMESIIIKMCSQVGIPIPKLDSSLHHEKESSAAEETWLYSILKSKSLSNNSIISALGVNDPDMTVVDIKIAWNNDRDMYLALLNSLDNFSEFSKDFKGMTPVQIAEYFYNIFEAILINDVVIILRGIPKQGSPSYEKILSSIASLAGAMCKAFETGIKNGELIGRMALVLEAEEELNILNIMKENERMILSVEQLTS